MIINCLAWTYDRHPLVYRKNDILVWIYVSVDRRKHTHTRSWNPQCAMRRTENKILLSVRAALFFHIWDIIKATVYFFFKYRKFSDSHISDDMVALLVIFTWTLAILCVDTAKLIRSKREQFKIVCTRVNIGSVIMRTLL